MFSDVTSELAAFQLISGNIAAHIDSPSGCPDAACGLVWRGQAHDGVSLEPSPGNTLASQIPAELPHNAGATAANNGSTIGKSLQSANIWLRLGRHPDTLPARSCRRKRLPVRQALAASLKEGDYARLR